MTAASSRENHSQEQAQIKNQQGIAEAEPLDAYGTTH
jgi:hypothetical protein